VTSPESPILSRMNTLKQTDFDKHLTDAQREALASIYDHRETGEPFINLHGPPEAGKTFLCWALHDDEWDYYQALPDRVAETTVIYDHGSPDKQATRRLRNKAELSGVACAVYVTRKAAEEVYPRVELAPEAAHYERVAENWDQLGLSPDAVPTPASGSSPSQPNTSNQV